MSFDQPVFLQFYVELYYIVKNRKFLSSFLANNLYCQTVHQKLNIKDITTVILVFQAAFEYCCFKMGKSPKMAQIS